jgi:hypothetical protein
VPYAQAHALPSLLSSECCVSVTKVSEGLHYDLPFSFSLSIRSTAQQFWINYLFGFLRRVIRSRLAAFFLSFAFFYSSGANGLCVVLWLVFSQSRYH